MIIGKSKTNYSMFLSEEDCKKITHFYSIAHEGKEVPKAKMIRYMIKVMSNFFQPITK